MQPNLRFSEISPVFFSCYWVTTQQLLYHIHSLLYCFLFILSYWVPESNGGASSNDMAYYFGGFLFIQDMIDQALISLIQSNETRDPEMHLGIYMQEFPYPCYSRDE